MCASSRLDFGAGSCMRKSSPPTLLEEKKTQEKATVLMISAVKKYQQLPQFIMYLFQILYFLSNLNCYSKTFAAETILFWLEFSYYELYWLQNTKLCEIALHLWAHKINIKLQNNTTTECSSDVFSVLQMLFSETNRNSIINLSSSNDIKIARSCFKDDTDVSIYCTQLTIAFFSSHILSHAYVCLQENDARKTCQLICPLIHMHFSSALVSMLFIYVWIKRGMLRATADQRVIYILI